MSVDSGYSGQASSGLEGGGGVPRLTVEEDKDFNDFDDDDDTSSAGGGRNSALSDDVDDRHDAPLAPVDLNKFMMGRTDSPVEVAVPAPIDTAAVTDTYKSEYDIIDEEEDEDEEGYETDEGQDGDVLSDLLGPSDEYKLIETTSREQLQLQLEHTKRMAREKKDALIKEYLQEIKQFYYLRKRNTILGFKITANIDQKQQVVEKYIQMQKDEIEKARETDMLKKLHIMESCQANAAFQKEKAHHKKKKDRKKRKSSNKSKRKSSSNKPKSPRQTRFNDDVIRNLFSPPEDKDSGEPTKHDLTIGELKELYTHTVQKATKKRIKFDNAGETNNKCDEKIKGKALESERKSSSKRAASFSFNRSLFLGDVLVDKPEGRKARLMNLRFSSDLNLRTKYSTKRLSKKRQSLHAKRIRLITAQRESKFRLTAEARQLFKSKSRMALDRESKQDQKILIEQGTVDLKDLNHFHFEFADHRLTAKQASVVLREEVLKMLRDRHIPTSQLTWPLQVKGVNYITKNPYGRIHLNYTRLSHHEKEHPYTAYRLVLTNIAYFRLKEQRLLQLHEKSQIEMQVELEKLVSGIQQILLELIEALKIWASLSGLTCRERYEAKQDTEKFIEYLKHMFDDVLIELFAELYKTIQSNEFALRKLSNSEGKGEGAELHEFKDIMRCREKLKVEHTTVQKFIMRYLKHSMNVLKNICQTDKKMHLIAHNIDEMSSEIKRFKLLLKSVTEGLQFCQSLALHQKREEKELRQGLGILSSPIVTHDYEQMLARKIDDRIRKQELHRKHNSVLRQVQKIKLSLHQRSRD